MFFVQFVVQYGNRADIVSPGIDHGGFLRMARIELPGQFQDPGLAVVDAFSANVVQSVVPRTRWWSKARGMLRRLVSASW